MLVVLPEPLTPTTSTTNGLARRSICSGCSHGASNLGQPLAQRARAAPRHRRARGARRGDSDPTGSRSVASTPTSARQQPRLQVLQHRGVDLAPAQQAAQIARDRGAAAIEARLEAREKPLRFIGVGMARLSHERVRREAHGRMLAACGTLSCGSAGRCAHSSGPRPAAAAAAHHRRAMARREGFAFRRSTFGRRPIACARRCSTGCRRGSKARAAWICTPARARWAWRRCRAARPRWCSSSSSAPRRRRCEALLRDWQASGASVLCDRRSIAISRAYPATAQARLRPGVSRPAVCSVELRARRLPRSSAAGWRRRRAHLSRARACRRRCRQLPAALARTACGYRGRGRVSSVRA